jgi:hypothetical protein
MEVSSILIPLENRSNNIEIKEITQITGIIKTISFVGEIKQQKQPINFIRDGNVVQSITPLEYQVKQPQVKHLVVIEQLNIAMTKNTKICITLLPNQKVLLTFFCSNTRMARENESKCPKNVKCDCGHIIQDHYMGGWCHSSGHPKSGQCGCTFFHPKESSVDASIRKNYTGKAFEKEHSEVK